MLDALKRAEASAPLDSYQLAKSTGLSPMQAGRTLVRLAADGIVVTDDPTGTVNDLAARFRLAAPAAST